MIDDLFYYIHMLSLKNAMDNYDVGFDMHDISTESINIDIEEYCPTGIFFSVNADNDHFDVREGEELEKLGETIDNGIHCFVVKRPNSSKISNIPSVLLDNKK